MPAANAPKHPAKFSDPILPVIASYLEPGWTVLDPFAGVGRIHEVRDLVDVHTFGVELEPEWAHCHPDTWCGDAMEVRGQDRWDAIATSVTYGNRFADKHNAQERCRMCGGTGKVLKPGTRMDPGVRDRRYPTVKCAKCDGKGIRNHHRRGYTHNLGRALSENNSGALQWGPEYREFHADWLKLAFDLVRRRLVLNVSDHIRDKQRQPVVRWFLDTAIDVGFEWTGSTAVPTNRMRDGANREARVPYEMVLCLDKEEVA